MKKMFVLVIIMMFFAPAFANNCEIESIGDRSVSYANGRIISIGNERVHYWQDGEIESIGDRSVSYDNGRIISIGNERVRYWQCRN